MTAEGCRGWKEVLGARALGQLAGDERAGLEAHLEGCAACRAELDALGEVARLLPLADPDRIEAAPAPPPSLGGRVAAAVRTERRSRRRRRLRLGFAFGGATAAALAAVTLVLLVLPGGEPTPERHVSFESLPAGLHIGAALRPHAYGTEIHMYVKGAPSGALCRVFLRGPGGKRVPAGSFRYRWGEDSDAVLSAALDLSRTRAIGVRVGSRTFVAPVS